MQGWVQREPSAAQDGERTGRKSQPSSHMALELGKPLPETWSIPLVNVLKASKVTSQFPSILPFKRFICKLLSAQLEVLKGLCSFRYSQIWEHVVNAYVVVSFLWRKQGFTASYWKDNLMSHCPTTNMARFSRVRITTSTFRRWGFYWWDSKFRRDLNQYEISVYTCNLLVQNMLNLVYSHEPCTDTQSIS